MSDIDEQIACVRYWIDDKFIADDVIDISSFYGDGLVILLDDVAYSVICVSLERKFMDYSRFTYDLKLKKIGSVVRVIDTKKLKDEL